jgi:hypothetical protein
MAAATTSAGGVPNCVLAPVQGQSLQTAYAQINPGNPQNLDIIQITVPGEPGVSNSPTPICILNVDFAGVVHSPAVSPTNGTRAGVFSAIDLTPNATVAQLFASAWRWNSTNSKADILQVVNIGGNISYWLDYLGVSHGA